ncbi:hypothetical protein ABIE27_001967 [Paenibacillus sp. 4624]
MNIIKAIKFKGFDVRIPFFSFKFEIQNPVAWKSGKANN